MSLLPEVHLEITWTMVAGVAPASMADACALSASCSELSSRLQDMHSQLWVRKLDCILGKHSWVKYSPQSLGHKVAPRQLCIWLLAAARLLRNALTCCDWLALVDALEVLATAGIGTARLLVPVLQSLVWMQEQPSTLQALQWLWDLAVGRARPWSGFARPTAEVVQLDRLRQWLHEYTSPAILPWHELELFRQNASFDGVFPQATQDLFTERVSRAAAFMLLVTECSPPPLDGGLGMIVSTAELASAVQAASCREGDAISYLWACSLLLLARCLRSQLSAARTDTELSSGGWHGISLSWQPTQMPLGQVGLSLSDPLPPAPSLIAGGGVELLHFPELYVDRWWMHTQHGTRGLLDGGRPQATVQFDVRLDPRAGYFLGSWIEYGGAKPLPARVFALSAWSKGLREWMSPTSLARDIRDQALDGNMVELFGVAGSATSEMIRCFHLSRCPSDPS